MEDGVNALHRPLEIIAGSNVAFRDLDGVETGEVRFLAAGEVVKDANLVAISDQAPNQVGSDKSRASSHQR